ncbi:MAG: mechanosensitive ion channel family protein [Fimbriimonadaceae bacterium]
MALLLAAPGALAQPKPPWLEGAPDFVSNTLFGVQAWQWIGLASVAAIAFVVSIIGRLAVVLAVRARDRFIRGAMSVGIRRLVRRAAAVLIFTWTCYALVGELLLPHHAAVVAARTLDSMQILGYVLLGCALWEAVSEEVAIRAAGRSDRAEKLLVPLTSKLVRATIITTGLVVAIAELTNVNVTALVTSLGIGGLVIALAAKDSIENVFGSITILFDMPFALGDWVKIDKVEGVVEQINLRSTRIRTFEDTVITLPNANLIRAAVENFGARRVRRQKLSVRLNSDNSPDATRELVAALRDYLAKASHVQNERAIVALDSVDDVAIGLFIQCHFEASTQQDEMRMRDDLLNEVLTQRDRCGVLLAGETRAAQDARNGKPPLK